VLSLSPLVAAAVGNAQNCTVCRSKGSPRLRPRRGTASGRDSRETRTGSAVASVSGRCWSGGRLDFASRESGPGPSFTSSSPSLLAELFFGQQCRPHVVLCHSSSKCRRSSARRVPRCRIRSHLPFSSLPSPQVPSFEFDTTQPIQATEGSTNTSSTILFSRTPANFTFPALVSLRGPSARSLPSITCHTS
jgi:hypothetical protein